MLVGVVKTNVAPDPRLGVVILGLLACNTTYYIVAGRLSEALESMAWYALLILFTLETMPGNRLRSAKKIVVLQGLRFLATLAIGVSAVLYVREKAWLDATNLFLWIAVVGLLEIEVRRPAAVNAYRKVFTRSATLLYAALSVMVLIWLARGEWMNMWDAALWLAAFGLLELNFLNREDET
ncbi:MAG TPA: hypothetical protein VK663_13940 [Burkholderiales bacterium]|nr:hypothetical protein [Burkholderiales bacterium]